MFSLTPAAADQILQVAQSSGAHHLALRVAARQDTDGEVEYGMGFDEAKDDDMRLELSGVAVLIAQEHQLLLDSTVLDFVELQPGESNFIFADASQFAADHNGAGCAAPTGGGCGSGACGGGGCASLGRTH